MRAATCRTVTSRTPMAPLTLALRVVPALLALLEVGVVLCVLHVALAATMRARGHAAWRLRDTALTVPLLTVGLAVAFAAINHGVARLAMDVWRGHPWGAHLTAVAGVLAVALVVAAFGVRAVRKLY
jgi:cytochrome bd-type quinol oxidase subunit 2